MLINFVPGEECRIAMTVDGKLEEFYHERASSESHVGSIYEGRVTNVEASIQAAFIDFGLERNGFLHISDLHPMYFPGKDREEFEKVGQKTARHERPPIQKCLSRGQKVLVQVLKEGIGTKGPTLSSYLSIPGRYLVMMPHMERLGVSRKVEDDDARREMKKVLADLSPPKDFGFIVRTAGMGQTKTDLKRDLAYLQRLWKSLEKRRAKLKRPGELYAESDLIIRTIRDVFTSDISRIVVDDPIAAARVRDFLGVVNPRTKSSVAYYNDPVPLFHRFKIEQQIDTINSQQVPLPSGGYLIIDQTEALVAIDVNSGKSRDAKDAESNAYNTNVEAVDEIARQLRLRDLGGVIVNDLIDMREMKHRRKIESRFRDNLKKDRARTRTNAITQFGLLEMTRQRMRPAVGRAFSVKCNHCLGSGHVKSAESTAIEVMRHLALVMHREDIERIELTVSGDTAFQLLNHKRSQLVALEKRFEKKVLVRVGGSGIDYVNIAAYDTRGGMLDAETIAESMKIAPPTSETFMRTDQEAFERLYEAVREVGTALPPAFIGFDMDEIEDIEQQQQVEEQIKQDQADKQDEDGENSKAGKGGTSGQSGRGKQSKSSKQDQDDDGDGDEKPHDRPGDTADDPSDSNDDSGDTSGDDSRGDSEGDSGGRKRRRRRGSRGGRRRRNSDKDGSNNDSNNDSNADDHDADGNHKNDAHDGNEARDSQNNGNSDGNSDDSQDNNDGSSSGRKRHRRGGRRRRRGNRGGDGSGDGGDASSGVDAANAGNDKPADSGVIRDDDSRGNRKHESNSNQDKSKPPRGKSDQSRNNNSNNANNSGNANKPSSSGNSNKPSGTSGYSNKLLGDDG